MRKVYTNKYISNRKVYTEKSIVYTKSLYLTEKYIQKAYKQGLYLIETCIRKVYI